MSRIARYPVPTVEERNLAGMFDPLGETIGRRIKDLAGKKGKVSADLLRFWEYARANLDADLHARIQQRYLPPDAIGLTRNPNRLKYIDPVVWLEGKLSRCRMAGLDRSPPQSILDIGTGGGHFAFVARFYGHSVTCIETPEELGVDREPRLYDDLCRLHGVDERKPCRITFGEPLPDLGQRFDLVTAWMAAFNAATVEPDDLTSRPRYRSWNSEEWTWFLHECRDRWMKPGARLVMNLADKRTPDEIWAFLARRALRVDHGPLYVDLRPMDYT